VKLHCHVIVITFWLIELMTSTSCCHITRALLFVKHKKRSRARKHAGAPRYVRRLRLALGEEYRQDRFPSLASKPARHRRSNRVFIRHLRKQQHQQQQQRQQQQLRAPLLVIVIVGVLLYDQLPPRRAARRRLRLPVPRALLLLLLRLRLRFVIHVVIGKRKKRDERSTQHHPRCAVVP
jgi:hypothetical protein